jgi:hypothetical protein
MVLANVKLMNISTCSSAFSPCFMKSPKREMLRGTIDA